MLEDRGALVVGVSSDPVESHCKFADKEELPFPILSDPGGAVRAQYHVEPSLFGLVPGRVTYVIDRSRRVRHAFRSQFKLRRHVREAQAAIESLESAAAH